MTTWSPWWLAPTLWQRTSDYGLRPTSGQPEPRSPVGRKTTGTRTGTPHPDADSEPDTPTKKTKRAAKATRSVTGQPAQFPGFEFAERFVGFQSPNLDRLQLIGACPVAGCQPAACIALLSSSSVPMSAILSGSPGIPSFVCVMCGTLANAG